MAYELADRALVNFDHAYPVLRGQTDLQFQLIPVKPPEPPAWLKWLVEHLHLGPLGKTLGPISPYIFWAALALGALIIIGLIVGRAVGFRPGGRKARLRLTGAEPSWRPAPEQARALLEDADRLAAEGQFAEAAHLILLRSVQDIQTRRPRALKPSLTSRDIAGLEGLPPQARDLFAGIAEAVEHALFGGRPLGRDDFLRCRQAYETFADAGSWA